MIHVRPLAAALAGFAIACLAAACGGSPASSPPAQSTVPPASSQPAAPVSSTPASGPSVKFTEPSATGGNYIWSASLIGPIASATSVQVGTGAGDAGQPMDAAPGQVFVVAKVHVVNTSGRTEPGYTDINNQRPQPLDLVVTMAQASQAGLKIWHFNNQNWSGIGPPPKGPQCGTSQGVTMGGDTYGHYCDLGFATANLYTETAQATNEGDGLSQPQIPAGGSQDLTIFVGPLPQSVPLSAVHIIAIDQGSGGNGFTVVG